MSRDRSKQKRRVPVLLLFNKVSTHPSAKGVEEAQAFMEESMILPAHTLQAVVKERIVFQHAVREGKGVVEYTPVNVEARQEIANASRELLDFVNRQPVQEVA